MSGYHPTAMRSVLAASVLALLVYSLPAARAADAPVWLPRYDVVVNLDVAGQRAVVTQHVTWFNRHQRPTSELIFNVHSAYEPPTGGINYLFLAKMLEIMRIPPGEAIYVGRPITIKKVTLLRRQGEKVDPVELPFRFRDDLPTALCASLPHEVAKDESVSVAIEFEFNMPQKQGRWGQWKGVTCLSNWLPVLSYYDEKGWQPTPFVAWHQPFFNEAGIYSMHLRLPADHKVAASGAARKRSVEGDWQDIWFGPVTTREFTLVASAKFQEYTADAGRVKVKCLAFPEHEFYGQAVVKLAARAIETYTKWFGPYPNDELVFAESYFGWNGNECSGLVMVDERVFGMPHLAEGYVEYLISHETCHQWFYNIIGTDGYRETFMDEAFANYFAHRLLNQIHGKNNTLFKYPPALEWLPNVNRDDYRFSTFYGTIGRQELGPALQDMHKYRHVINLFSAAYDRGSKIVGMIEERLGEAAFFDFMRIIYRKYYFRIIFAGDLQRELEEYTGQSWEEFFRIWLLGNGLTDWKLESAKVTHPKPDTGQHQVVVLLKQQGENHEPTTLGFSFKNQEGYPIRLPIDARAGPITIDQPPARIEPQPDGSVRVEVLFPEKPTQITVDPDQILPDREPANNSWKSRANVRVTPLYTFLDDNDLAASYDRWNFTIGPWVYGASYSDPWFTRASILGVRAGAFRTQQFSGGAYLGYRTDFRDIAAGFDSRWLNPIFPKTEAGFQAEKSLTQIGDDHNEFDRAVLYQRYIFDQAASLYTQPMHYVEGYGSWQRNFLLEPRHTVPGSIRYGQQSNLGIHYHVDYLTPYWDPEVGAKLDVTYAAGLPILGQPQPTHQVMGQISWIHSLPANLGYFSRTRFAYRLFGAAALPNDINLFTLGGNQLFRGFDMQERQGSSLWIASAEWRFPLLSDEEIDVADHVVGFRRMHLAAFYDAGDIYAKNQSVGPVAHAVGIGIRAELAWFSFIERTTFRLDLAKTVNADTPLQFWLGITHPF